MKRCVILLAACALGHAASVAGRVFDPSGAAIARAELRLVESGGSAGRWQAVSQEDGRYEFTGVPAGSFELQVLVPGFAAFRRNATLRQADDRLELNPILRLGEIQETIRVTAAGNPAAGGPRRIRMGGNVQPARLVQRTNPEYPDQARQEGREGTVVTKALIAKDGAVIDVTPMTGSDPGLAAAAAAAIRQWKYQPALLNGAPVEIVTVIETVFRLSR